MDKETLSKYSIIPVAIAFVVSVFFGIQPDPTHYCETEQIQRYCFDVSGGSHSRCYISPEKNSWDNCITGWKPIPEWIDKYSGEESVIKVFGNGCMHDCITDNGEINSYTYCECENGNFAYLGELI